MSRLGGPGARPSRLLLAGVLGVLVLLIELELVQVAYERIGLSARGAWLLLLASLAGSGINLPVARLRVAPKAASAPERAEGDAPAVGSPSETPDPGRPGRSIVAVNLGGAAIPAAVAAYLLWMQPILLPAAAATLAVAAGVHAVARPVPGVGIATPFFAPPLLAAGAALLVPSPRPAAVAFVCGTLGTLVGADLWNLRRLPSLGAPLVAIGGAGTFDGIFLAGIVAVLLA